MAFQMIMIGLGFAVFFFVLSFIISKLGKLPIYWVSLSANTGFFLAFLLVGRAFPEEAQTALFYLNLGILTFVLIQAALGLAHWLLKKTATRQKNWKHS
ncbi:hypothetical protein [Listeria grandensis]|uniref:hypothetical protein n=1 Tax=Listeria grandensis TaxID=1494963 RepID=UPI00164D5702|nr:hypothetical protein [Listeria grandensis]MBC6314345.1 hypothetical protein [Listeria grandensis]